MDIVAEIVSQRFVAVLRGTPDLDEAAEELVGAGVRVLEITLDTPGALEAIGRWRGRAAVVAGTVRTAAEAEAAQGAGAAAVVSPASVPEVAAFCREAGLPYVPGALTPTEVESAWRSGAALVKLFPASLGGPDYLRSLRGPLADVPLVATGGVTAANANAFLEAGAAAVGSDSSRALAVWEAVRVAR